MIKLLSYILIFLAVACNKSNSNQTLLISNSTTLNESVQNDIIYKTCEEPVTSLVRSSNAVVLQNFKNAQIRIDTIAREKIIVELFVSNNISEDPSVKRIAVLPHL